MKLYFVLMLLVGQIKSTKACDCDTLIGKKEATTVFKGTVYSINRIDSDFVRYEVVFKIKRRIKGRMKEKRITVNVPCLLDMCCGIPFKEGESYVIYSFIRNGMLYTNTCTESKRAKSKLLELR